MASSREEAGPERQVSLAKPTAVRVSLHKPDRRLPLVPGPDAPPEVEQALPPRSSRQSESRYPVSADSGPEQPLSPPPTTKRRSLALAVGSVVALLAVIAASFWWGRMADRSPAAASAPLTSRSTPSAPTTPGAPAKAAPVASAAAASTPTESPATPSLTPSRTRDASAQALAALRATADDDLRDLSLDGHWIAMLAGKTPGLVDPLDPPPEGAKWTLPAIATQHEQLRADPRFDGRVYLVLSTSFGRAVTDAKGRPYYVTIYDGDFTGPRAVRSWCSQTFVDLTADQRADRCAPAQLSEPH